ncbi:MAG: D-alanine--D-alanine ligase [Chloroflexi bacterium]|nr:MAG: D-alanine--D-alanine ligase [Chloroflexota bacterium]
MRVGVIFGGRSGEHEVSLRSAVSVMAALDRERYEVVPIGITRDGYWLVGGDPMALLRAEVRGGRQAPRPAGGPLAQVSALLDQGLDVVFPVLHGPYGEDGTIQGLLEMAGIPYVGAGVAASALAMDKGLFKDLMRAHDLPVVRYQTILRREWEEAPEAVLDRIEGTLRYPIFTKPANLGSSVGVSKCRNRSDLLEGLMEAARFDRKLLAEEAVPHAREIEVSVLGNDEPEASLPGEIIPSREFYDYAAKYIDDGEAASQLLIPAPLTPEETERVRELAVRAYRVMDGAGMARVDFLMNGETGEFFISEANTIPGFTSISMYPKLWEATGLPFAALVDRLIELALARHREQVQRETRYDLGRMALKEEAGEGAG